MLEGMKLVYPDLANYFEGGAANVGMTINGRAGPMPGSGRDR